MKKRREVVKEQTVEVTEFHEALERARQTGESFITYLGDVYSIARVEDITHTFSPGELEDFEKAYAAADDPNNLLTVEEALAKYAADRQADEP